MSRLFYMSATQDQNIGKQRGARTLDEFISDLISDAESPEQFDAVAFQLLCMARRVKTAGFRDAAKQWKDGWRRCLLFAEQARARLASVPTNETARHLFNPRFLSKPGTIYGDIRMPLFARIDFSDDPFARTEYFTGTYEPPLRPDTVYRISLTRLNSVWLTNVATGKASEMQPSRLIKLWKLGRVVAVQNELAQAA